MSVIIAPSILSCDFGKINDELAAIEPHVEWAHLDVMDGHFVPNITFGAPVVKYIKTNLFKDCHLMIENPEKYVEDFVKAGVDSLTFHIEATEDAPSLVQKIKDLGVKAAVSIKPKTPVSSISHIIEDVDMVLVMSVEPGFGGQSFMPEVLDKVRELKQIRPDLHVQIDGGINAETSKLAIEAGVDSMVSGSYIFKSDDRVAAIESLRH